MTPAPLNLAVLPEAQNLNGSGFFLSISVMNKKSEHTSPLHSYQATDIRPPSQLINNHINPLKQSLTMLLHTLYLFHGWSGLHMGSRGRGAVLLLSVKHSYGKVTVAHPALEHFSLLQRLAQQLECVLSFDLHLSQCQGLSKGFLRWYHNLMCEPGFCRDALQGGTELT